MDGMTNGRLMFRYRWNRRRHLRFTVLVLIFSTKMKERRRETQLPTGSSNLLADAIFSFAKAEAGSKRIMGA